MPKLIEFLLVYAWVWVWVCSTIKTEQFNRTFMIWAAKVFWLTLFTVYGALHFGIVHGSFFFSSSSSPYRMHRNTPLDKYIIEKEIIKRKECTQANNWTHTHTHKHETLSTSAQQWMNTHTFHHMRFYLAHLILCHIANAISIRIWWNLLDFRSLVTVLCTTLCMASSFTELALSHVALCIM